MSGDSPTVNVRLLFFAKARELAGVSGVNVHDLPASSTGAGLLKAVLSRFPVLDPIKDSVILAHNLEYVDLEGDAPVEIKEGDEIAVIPPVSGG